MLVHAPTSLWKNVGNLSQGWSLCVICIPGYSLAESKCFSVQSEAGEHYVISDRLRVKRSVLLSGLKGTLMFCFEVTTKEYKILFMYFAEVMSHFTIGVLLLRHLVCLLWHVL